MIAATDVDLTIALGASDLNRALIDGTVTIQGATARCLTFPSPERHWRMFRRHEFDAAEVSFGTYLSLAEQQPGDFVAIPAFPHRRFRHSFLYTAAMSSLTDPGELAGRRIGLRTWTNSAGVWTKGILGDQYGLDLRSVEWVIQDADTAGMDRLPDTYGITPVAAGESVVDLTARGELDALIYPETPKNLGEAGGLRRLLPDSRTAEIDYFRSTGVFPIMHTVALARRVIEEFPWLPYELLRAFRTSKDRALEDIQDPRKTCLAWARDAYEHQVELMGSDPFRYDAHASQSAIETLLRYAEDQGILNGHLGLDDLFHPTTLNEPPAYVGR